MHAVTSAIVVNHRDNLKGDPPDAATLASLAPSIKPILLVAVVGYALKRAARDDG